MWWQRRPSGILHEAFDSLSIRGALSDTLQMLRTTAPPGQPIGFVPWFLAPASSPGVPDAEPATSDPSTTASAAIPSVPFHPIPSDQRLCAVGVGAVSCYPHLSSSTSPSQGDTPDLLARLMDEMTVGNGRLAAETWVQQTAAGSGDLSAAAREQQPRGQWTMDDWADECAAQESNGEEAESDNDEEFADVAEGTEHPCDDDEEELDEARREGEQQLQDFIMNMLLGRAHCPEDVRLHLLSRQGRLADFPPWGEALRAAGFYNSSVGGPSGSGWEDADQLRWVDPWGCASWHRDQTGDIWSTFCPWRSSEPFDAVEEAERPEMEQLHRRHRGSRRGRAGARDGGGASF